uniref:Uncharacterized protein n=1 Tax=Tanacetum cinerariifolium TaxID=118510 RepID=A0A6L2MC73_TANCI|nr:hypothetical protein [Tanacetum cinerariifolium]
MDKCKTGLGYNDIPTPYTRNFFPPKPDLSGLEEFENEHIVTKPIVKKHAVKTSEAKANSEDEAESKPKIEKKTVKPSFAKIEFVKSKKQIMKKLIEDMLPLEATLKEGKSQAKVNDDAGNARMETVPGKYYILLPLWTADPLISQESKSSQDDGFQPSSDDGKKVDDF